MSSASFIHLSFNKEAKLVQAQWKNLLSTCKWSYSAVFTAGAEPGIHYPFIKCKNSQSSLVIVEPGIFGTMFLKISVEEDEPWGK